MPGHSSSQLRLNKAALYLLDFNAHIEKSVLFTLSGCCIFHIFVQALCNILKHKKDVLHLVKKIPVLDKFPLGMVIVLLAVSSVLVNQ